MEDELRKAFCRCNTGNVNENVEEGNNLEVVRYSQRLLSFVVQRVGLWMEKYCISQKRQRREFNIFTGVYFAHKKENYDITREL